MNERSRGSPPSGDREQDPADRRLGQLIEGLADAVVVVDRHGEVRFVNRAGESLFGRSRKELLGSPFGFPVAAAESAEIDLPGGRVAEMRVVEVTWEGRPAWAATLRDVTDRRQAELVAQRLAAEQAARQQLERDRGKLLELTRELEQAMERLREEDRRKDRLMAALGHELRNPLAALDGGLALLAARAGGGATGPLVERMRAQVRRQKAVLDGLLDISNMARGQIHLHRVRVDLRRLVDDAVESCADQLEERREDLEVGPWGEPLMVLGDKERLDQAVCQLLLNAVKFSARGSPITLQMRKEGESAVLVVSDRGAGIEPRLLERIFEPFVQGAAGDESPVSGLGIGLTLARLLVEAHGGSISAQSRGAGKGSDFVVRLPLAPAVDESGAESTTGPVRGAPASKRVLVVDDNADAAAALAELLALSDFEVETAGTGAEAIAKAREKAYAVVLLDLQLPDTTGYHVAERLRSELGHESALLVVISGFGDQAARDRSLASGVDHHLLKPVAIDRLLELMRAHASAT